MVYIPHDRNTQINDDNKRGLSVIYSIYCEKNDTIHER